ncbi:MAG: sporulation protein YabP [Halanaerobium sp.]|nr:sporulation protein YabP [Halanaerobium sp.]
MEKKETNKSIREDGHNLVLKNRQQMSMSGVKEVLTFNEENILLQTSQGDLEIRGEKLNVQRLNLDDGNLEIIGLITHVEYVPEDKKRGLLKRLFK